MTVAVTHSWEHDDKRADSIKTEKSLPSSADIGFYCHEENLSPFCLHGLSIAPCILTQLKPIIYLHTA